MMQGMMAQITQMGQLMKTMQRVATVGQQQQQGQQPPPIGGVVSRIINDISRQRPPIFEGSSEPVDIIHWIDHLEKLFEMVSCPEENRTAVAAAYYLGKSAHIWWLATRPTDGVYMWDELKNRMLDRYYPAPLREVKLSELLNSRVTEDENVLSIAEKFQALLPFATLIIRSNADKIKYFLKRLKPRMWMQLLNHHCTTLVEFIERALENELTAKELFKKPSSGGKRPKIQYEDTRGAFKKPQSIQNSLAKAPAALKPAGSSSRAVNSNTTCHNSGAPGHISPSCPKPPVQCNSCGKSGHRARYCRGGPGRTLAVPYTSAQPLAQIRAPPSSSYQTMGDNQGLCRGNQASTSGVGAAKPRVYEMRKVDDPKANMIAVDDVILGIDWMDRHDAILSIRKRMVIVTTSDGLDCVFQGDNPNRSGRVISAMKAVRLLNQGCVGFFVLYDQDHRSTSQASIFRSFRNSLTYFMRSYQVYLQLARQNSLLISSPVHIKSQLEELTEKGYVRPSASPWGAPVDLYVSVSITESLTE
ncbi:hypothetical protein OROGR_024453 [Orobanche gracilis]